MQVQYLNRLHLAYTVNLNTVPVVSTEMLLLNDIFKKKKNNNSYAILLSYMSIMGYAMHMGYTQTFFQNKR